MFAIRPNHPAFTVEKAGGLPVVAKQLTGSQGTGVSILETPLSANTTLESFSRANIPIKLQRFIKAARTNGQVTGIRAIVVGDKVVSAIQRTANSGDFRANLSRGGSGNAIQLSDAEKELCVKAAKAVGLEFAGVDLIREQSATNSVYVTEVNGNPGTGIIELSGHNHFVDLVAHLELKTGNTATTETTTPVTTTTTTEKNESEAHSYPLEYLTLAILERDNKKLSATQSGLLAFYKRKYGYVNVNR